MRISLLENFNNRIVTVTLSNGRSVTNLLMRLGAEEGESDFSFADFSRPGQPSYQALMVETNNIVSIMEAQQ